MKKLMIIPILLVCLTSASTRNVAPQKSETLKADKVVYEPNIKVDELDSLLKKL